MVPYLLNRIHSNNSDGRIYLYSLPSRVQRYYRDDELITHIHNVLSIISPFAKWNIVIDTHNFNHIHLLKSRIAMKLARIVIDNYSFNLDKILIIQDSPFFNILLNAMYPIIPPDIQLKIKMINLHETKIAY